MIRERQILDSVILHYTGQPSSVSVSLDGVSVASITNLPNHTSQKSRRVSLPAGNIGYIPQFSTDSTTRIDAEFVLIPADRFQEQLIWHYYEVTYSGTVSVSVDLDENNIVLDQELTIPNIAKVSTPKKTHTKKVYLPPLSFGYVPHLRNKTNDAGDITNAKPVALPLRFYQGEQTLSEGQITCVGDLQVQFYMDGRELGSPYQFDQETHDTGLPKYVTKKFYFPSGSIGHIFQWNQVSGDGDIAKIETDASIGATDVQPQVSDIK